MVTNPISIYNNNNNISNITDSNKDLISELDNNTTNSNNNINTFNNNPNIIITTSTTTNSANTTNNNNSEKCQSNNIVINNSDKTMLLSPRSQQQPLSSKSLNIHNIFNTTTMNANEEFLDHYSNQSTTTSTTNLTNTNNNSNQPSNQSHIQIPQSTLDTNTQNALGYYPFIANQNTESSQLIQQQQQEMQFHQLQLQQQQQQLLQLQIQNQSIQLLQQQQQQSSSSSSVNVPESPLATFQPAFNQLHQSVIQLENQTHLSSPQPQQPQQLQTLQQQSDYFLQQAQAQAQLQISQQVQQQIQQRFNEIPLQNYESRSDIIQQQVIPPPQPQQMQYIVSHASSDLTNLQNLPVQQQTVNNSEAGSLPIISVKYEDNFEVPKRSQSDNLVVGSSTEINKSYINNSNVLPSHNLYQFNHIQNPSISSQTTSINDDLLLDDEEVLSLLTGDENGSVGEEEHEDSHDSIYNEYSQNTNTIIQNDNFHQHQHQHHNHQQQQQQSQESVDYANSLTEMISNHILTANSPCISESVSPKSPLLENPNYSQSNVNLINNNRSNVYIPSKSHSPIDSDFVSSNIRKSSSSPSIPNAKIPQNLPINISKYIIETVKNDKKIFKCAICDKVLTRKETLKNHVSSVHFKLKLYKCKVIGCESKYSTPSDLRRHFRETHNNKQSSVYVCKVIDKNGKEWGCQRSFFRGYQLKNHWNSKRSKSKCEIPADFDFVPRRGTHVYNHITCNYGNSDQSQELSSP